MKFSTSALLAVVAATSVAAQQAHIAAPKNATDVKQGSDLMIEVARPNLQGPGSSFSEEVGIVLSYVACSDSGACVPPSQGTGKILYKGPYDPQPNLAFPSIPPHQNFTVKIPGDGVKGAAQIALTQFSLAGNNLVPTTMFDIVHINVI
ncbi:hypothetical protein V5O48_009110 [Marasmius crinis-equi]|uniref:Uncharacterized protein n=1 Tax=Marasmius crinis-equi TaxID=585013 RepID=A0ABR3FC22_9AGAR